MTVRCYNFNQGIAPCAIAMLDVVCLLGQVNRASGTWYVVPDWARVLFNPYHEGRTKAGKFYIGGTEIHTGSHSMFTLLLSVTTESTETWLILTFHTTSQWSTVSMTSCKFDLMNVKYQVFWMC